MGDAGVIVNITDVAVLEAWPLFAPHAAAKAALAQLTRSLARAIRARGARVRGRSRAGAAAGRQRRGAARAAGGAHGARAARRSPDDVVGAVAYLIEADYVTGEQLVVDGGHAL